MRRNFSLALLLVALICIPNTAGAAEANVREPNGDTIRHSDLESSAQDGTFCGVTTLGDGQSLTQIFTIENPNSLTDPILCAGGYVTIAEPEVPFGTVQAFLA